MGRRHQISKSIGKACKHPMKYQTIASIALLLGIATQSHSEMFIRPIVSSVNPSTSGISNATGVGFCTGVYWREKTEDVEKEISFEFLRANWSADASDAGYNGHASATFMPLLLNLRVNVCPDNDLKLLRLYIGPSFGETRATAKLHITGNGADFYASDSDWSFSWGGSAGFLIRVSERVDIDVGYRYLSASESKFSYQGSTFSTGTNKANIYYCGVGVRF